MAELLLELFSEEIPARMQGQVAAQLQQELVQRLEAIGLYSKKVKVYVTPRRVVLFADNLSGRQEGAVAERKGPRTDAPEGAIAGFCRSSGVAREALVVRQTDKGEFFFAITTQEAKPTKLLLKDMLEAILAGLTWPKSMRWGSKELRWVRPLHNIACVFAGEVLPIRFGDFTVNDNSIGHRFLGAKPFKITTLEAYKQALEERFVLLDGDIRKRRIAEQATLLAKQQGCELVLDERLLDEVAGLVEYPHALLGRIPSELMQVPEEVLISSIKTHQKYFVMRSKTGGLAPYFVVIANMPEPSAHANIIAGNERVLRARLSDAVFFWQQDQAVKLQTRVPMLDGIVFHAKIGTVGDKVRRITELGKLLGVWIPRASLEKIERTARLCKADLVSGMVGEFPELQGIMGAYYTRLQGEDAEISEAILAHYAPLGPTDAVPNEPVAIAVALADKLDTLVGMFAAGEKPTGSKDPFALRRAALGILRIILENGLRVPLRLACEKALHQYPASLLKKAGIKQKTLVNELLAFFVDRLKVQLKGQGVRHDTIAAVSAAGDEDDMVRLVLRVRSLEQFLQQHEGVQLLAAYRRTANILRAEEKKAALTFSSRVAKGKLQQKEEQELFARLQEGESAMKATLKAEKFEEMMVQLSRLHASINAFFDHVTVNAEDEKLRKNRLQLLALFRNQCNEIADLSLIEG